MTDTTTASPPGTPGTQTTPGTTTAPSATTPPATPPAFSWQTSGLDADHLNWIGSKGNPDLPALVTSHRALERMIGVPAEQIIKLPGKDAGPEAMTEVWNRLGRPATADGYKLPVPEGVDPAFSKTAAGWFHEAGVPAGMAEKITARWNEHAAAAAKTATEARGVQLGLEQAQLKAEWGPKYEPNVGVIDKAARVFGMDDKQVLALRDAMGYIGAMKFLHNIGLKLGADDSFIAGDGKGGFTGGETAEQARAKISSLQSDKEWGKRYLAGGATERAELERLHRVAYPSG